MDYAQKVQNGIVLLDQYWGPDWRSRIDKDRLRMSNVGDCILGQLFGEYHFGLNRLGLNTSNDADDTKSAAFHGFYVANREQDGGIYRWGNLHNAWVLAI